MGLIGVMREGRSRARERKWAWVNARAAWIPYQKKKVSARCRNVIMDDKTCLFLVDQSDKCPHGAGHNILVCLPSRLNGNVLILLLDVLSEPFADGHLQRSLGSLALGIPPVPLCNRSLAPPNSNTRTAGTST